MAAIPPTIGFTAKETAFEAVSYLVADGDGTGVPVLPAVLLAVALVAGSALTVGYTLRFLWGAFATKSAAGASDRACTPLPPGAGRLRRRAGAARRGSAWPAASSATS